MSSRSPLVRALLLLLALVPVAWGTCPRWIAGEACGATARADGGHAPVARCPCCPPVEDEPGTGPQRSSKTDPGNCPVIQLRFTVAPAPADVVVPAVDGVAVVAMVAPSPAPVAPRFVLEPRDTTGGAPPPRVGTVVLRI